MPVIARFSHEGDEHVEFTPTVNVTAGTPVELSSGYWGVPSLDVRANTSGVFRVSGVFRGLKINPSTTFAVGDQLVYGTGGFESGSGPWRVREASPSGATTVAVEINPSGLLTSGGGGGGGGGTCNLTTGDKGDITVNTFGSWSIDSKAVSYAKIQDVGSWKLLGNATGSTGPVAEVPFTSFISTLLDDTTAQQARDTLGIVTPPPYAPEVHTHDAADIVSGTINVLRLGTGTRSSTTYLNGLNQWVEIDSAQIATGVKDDINVVTQNVWTIVSNAVEYGKIQQVGPYKLLGNAATLPANVAEVTFTPFTATLLDDATAAEARITLGLGTAAVEPRETFALASHTHDASQIVSGTINVLRLGTGTRSSTTYLNGLNQWVEVNTSATLPDGDYGDIVVASGTWSVDDDADINFRSATIGATSSGGARLYSTSPNRLDLRNALSPNNLAVYKTYTNDTNYERVELGWVNDTARIRTTQGNNGGTTRGLIFQTDDVTRLEITLSGAIAFNSAYTFPTTAGTNGQVLQTNSGGQLSWATVSGTGGTPAGSTTQVQYNDAGAFGASAAFTFGDTANTSNKALSLGSNAIHGSIKITGPTQTGSVYSENAVGITQTWNTGLVAPLAPIFISVTDTSSATATSLFTANVSGTEVFRLGKRGYVKARHGVYADTTAGAGFSWSDGTGIYYDAAGTAGQRDGANAQKFAVYNKAATNNLPTTGTAADPGLAYERGVLDWKSSLNVFRVGTERGSGGTARAMHLVTDGAQRIGIAATGAVTFNEAYTFPTGAGTDGQTLQINGSGQLNWVTASQSGSATPYATMYFPDHGLTSNDIGKAVYVADLLDDTDATHFFTGVIVSISDANNFSYAKEGDTMSLPAARISSSYNYTTESRFLYWDLSANSWTRTKPVDSVPANPPGVLVNSYSSASSTYNVTVLGYGKMP